MLSALKKKDVVNGIQLKTQTKSTYLQTPDFLKIKNPEIHNGKKKALSTNSTSLSECQHGEECKYIHIYHPAQNTSPSGSKTSP